MPGRTVLVADDDDAIREVVKVALELTAGWSVRTASSGPEAVFLARNEPVDALLLDVMMPAVDGPATVSMLRGDRRTRDLPVIFLTAKSAGGEPTGADGVGVAGVIVKPFDPLTLADDVARLLGWSR